MRYVIKENLYKLRQNVIQRCDNSLLCKLRINL